MLGFLKIDAGADTETRKRDQHAVLLALVGIATTFATLAFMVFSQFQGWLAAAGIGGLIVFAGMACGGFLGFLFAVPRILARDVLSAPPPPATGAAAKGSSQADATATAAATQQRLLGSNTNLERISEWLTTMLVGVGLTQIGSLGEKMRLFASFLDDHAKVFETATGPTAGALPAAGPFLLVTGLVTGFIFFYLYTRIYLSPLFQHVEEIFSGREGMKTLEVGQTQVQEAAAKLAQISSNPSMTHTAQAKEISIDDSLDVIFNLLYEDDGYLEAIDIGNTLAASPAARLARYWFLMAAAHGQRHHELIKAKASKLQLQQAKNAVLNAVRKAVGIDESYKARLWALADPDSEDDDLQDFEKDADFLRIVR